MVSVQGGVSSLDLGLCSELFMRVVNIEDAGLEGRQLFDTLVPAMAGVLLDYVVPSLRRNCNHCVSWN